MHLNEIKIDIDQPVSEWHRLLETMPANDFILIEKNRDKMIWFITNYTQFLARRGGYEIAPLYGKAITDLASFIYQVNLSLPVSYQLGVKMMALYDLLLNFETEPKDRFIIWNDADHLLNLNGSDFAVIFKLLIVAAYCNRNGISTIKEDGTRYTVNQRNVFVLGDDSFENIKSLVDKEYYIPSIDGPFDEKIDFNIVRLIGEEFDNYLSEIENFPPTA